MSDRTCGQEGRQGFVGHVHKFKLCSLGKGNSLELLGREVTLSQECLRKVT